jgi:hypothetical protein
MLSPTAIVSLACLISTGEVDTAKATENLSKEDIIRVQRVLDSKVCLPEIFQNMINPSNEDKPLHAPTTDQ